MRNSTPLMSRIALAVGMAALAGCNQSAKSEIMTDSPTAQNDATTSPDSTETPAYTVLDRADATAAVASGVELREYAPKLTARVTVTARNADEASSKGFRPLAGFIFGDNRPREEIAMTAPVTTSPSGGEQIAMTAPVTSMPSDEPGEYTVEFVMPSNYTMETLPRPSNDDVRVERTETQMIVAAGFIGERSPSRINELKDAIRAYVDQNDLEPTGPFAQAGYSGPSVPRDQRKWEVHLPVTR